ncbi:hypothetical protein N9045_01685 [bacterium]|nr:hypothetical protein [bacterium]
MRHKSDGSIEHTIEDADNSALGEHEQFDQVTLIVEQDAHGLTVRRLGSDGEILDSYLCLDLQSGVLRCFIANSEDKDGEVVFKWGEDGFGHLICPF